MANHWRVAEPCPPDLATVFGFEGMSVDHAKILSQLLWNRGLRTKAEAVGFLEPLWETHLHDPAQFRHMAAAIERVFRALENDERITVHGDYDADGVTGSTVLITTLRELESKRRGGVFPPIPSNVDFYIPHRDKEGYGLHRETVPKLFERGTKLIITVDCGIACVAEIALAKEQSMDTIVIDHHQFGETLPDGHLIHPGLPEETYPFKSLAAVGVAFKFSCALLDDARRRGLDIPPGWEKWLLDLVAIATVTDMVPMVGENRLLEIYGLRVLNKTRRVGLSALLESAGLVPGTLDAESIGFSIGPRLNAAGRMDHASLALRLMLSESPDEAKILAAELEQCNRNRQEATKKMMVEAEAKLEQQVIKVNGELPKVLMVWDEHWSPALVGLVAGKFTERFHRPTIAVGSHEGNWIGSGRSFATFNITEAMRSAGGEMLTRIGGHVQACGFALRDADFLPVIAERLVEQAAAVLTEQAMVDHCEIDQEISLDALDESLVKNLDRIAPYGMGNPRPVFLSRNVLVAQTDTVGSTKNHLRMKVVTPNGRRMSAIGFKLGSRAAEFPPGAFADIVYNVDINEWNGRREVQGKLIDIRLAEKSL